MPRSVREVAERIREATQPGFRGRLLARGLARNLVWSEGRIPEGGQQFSPLLTGDLLSYGVSLLQLGLELRSLSREAAEAGIAFERAAEALESVVKDGDPADSERGFYTVLAAASYHLGHFSARAYSLFPSSLEAFNLSPAEHSFTLLLRRDLTALQARLFDFSAEGGFDARLSAKLASLGDDAAVDESIPLALDALYHRALAMFDFALEAGGPDAVQESLRLLKEGAEAASECGAVPFWWIFTLTRHLLDDLWDQSLHVRLPSPPAGEAESKWRELRSLFIAKLLRQDRSEIELWPSQLDAAVRAFDVSDDLVAALPTSAGKTRIAEICILRTLSLGKRVVFVTPLRALSAQTERSLRQTFAALGCSVSSLYGSSGTTGDDADSLRSRTVVVSTPEKLDFALRSNADLLDDVGLVVFDEAHTIGAGEREIRYEVLVQRLLTRADAAERRIVCLSAILPEGKQLDDFVSWMRQDQPGKAISMDWRPTRQRFGDIAWFSDLELTKMGDLSKNAAMLTFRLEDIGGDDAPYVRGFVVGQPALGKQRTPLPRDRRDLSLMSAWKLVDEGHSVLLYCPQRSSVLPMARTAIDLVRRGYLKSLLQCPPAELEEALSIGREWLGENHPVVDCLRLGVAVHHGQLPRPFLRAIEKLLKRQLLKVTIASPTLAQGLNLSATTVLFTSLTRRGETIPGEEFANVAGRAGRAFVDVEGQVLCATWDKDESIEWDQLIKKGRHRDLRSGLLQLVLEVCKRIADGKGVPIAKVLEHVMGNANLWTPPLAPQKPRFWRKPKPEELEKERIAFERQWRADLASLDSALLSLVQQDVPIGELAKAIDLALKGSLWQRSVQRESELMQKISRALLIKRAAFIWESSTPTQRKGYFFAGVGLSTGQYLDQNAEALQSLLLAADGAFAARDIAAATESLISFAKLAFAVEPFKPREALRKNWEAVLKDWVAGESMADLAGNKDEELLEFIEDALVYRLVWAMESVRVRYAAEDEDAEWPNAGRAATALETGTSDYCAALLIQNGLASRTAALAAIADCPAAFTDIKGLRAWVRSNDVVAHTASKDWPTPETCALWRTFLSELQIASAPKWSVMRATIEVAATADALDPGTSLRFRFDPSENNIKAFTFDLDPYGYLPYTWNRKPEGVIIGAVSEKPGHVEITYIGPPDFFSES